MNTKASRPRIRIASVFSLMVTGLAILAIVYALRGFQTMNNTPTLSAVDNADNAARALLYFVAAIAGLIVLAAKTIRRFF